MAEDNIEVTHLFGKKLDKPIKIALGSKSLKKCPFCGGEEPVTVIIRKGKDGWRDRYAVLCDYDYGGCGAESGWYHYEEEAIEAWNRRTNDDRI